jgi:cell division protein FtsA
LRKGLVVDGRAAAQAVSISVQRAESQSGFKIMSALVGIAGAHICTTQSHAIVAVRGPNGVIDQADIDRALDSARVTQLPPDQEIFHTLPRHFAVDGADGFRDPVGRRGQRLELDASIVSGSATPMRGLVQCVENAGLELEELVLEPLAAGLAALSEKERQLGVLLIDLGGGTTDAAAFRDGALIHSTVLPVGGFQVSNDLSVGLGVGLQVAEEVKVRHGATTAHLDLDPPRGRLTLPHRHEQESVDRHTIAEIIDARLEETFALIRDEIALLGLQRYLAAGIVLTGGSARIPGAAVLASQVFEAPARLGAPESFPSLPDSLRGPEFSASVGLVLWGADQLESSAGEGTEGRIGRTGSAMRAWLRNLFG